MLINLPWWSTYPMRTVTTIGSLLSRRPPCSIPSLLLSLPTYLYSLYFPAHIILMSKPSQSLSWIFLPRYLGVQCVGTFMIASYCKRSIKTIKRYYLWVSSVLSTINTLLILYVKFGVPSLGKNSFMTLCYYLHFSTSWNLYAFIIELLLDQQQMLDVFWQCSTNVCTDRKTRSKKSA